MSKNPLSTSGMAEDLIRSYIQFGCAEVHAKTLYEKTIASLNNGLINVEDNEELQKALNKADMYKEDINTYAELRRNVMRYLFNMFDGDREMWCQAKHLGIACYTLFEAYQASDDDVELLHMAYEANSAFVKAMSRFLGTEITECSACFSEMVRGIDDEDSN